MVSAVRKQREISPGTELTLSILSWVLALEVVLAILRLVFSSQLTLFRNSPERHVRCLSSRSVKLTININYHTI